MNSEKNKNATNSIKNTQNRLKQIKLISAGRDMTEKGKTAGKCTGSREGLEPLLVGCPQF